jgi:pilus assembly protein Flp/PilA
MEEKYTFCGHAYACRSNEWRFDTRLGTGAGMLTKREPCRRFLADESGATAVEYGLICSCIFLVMIAAVTNFGAAATNMFNHIANAISNAP